MLTASLVLVRRLESRLALLSEPVSPLGMLELEALVGAEVGPLSCPEHASGLPTVLVRTLAALERR